MIRSWRRGTRRVLSDGDRPAPAGVNVTGTAVAAGSGTKAATPTPCVLDRVFPLEQCRWDLAERIAKETAS